MDPYSQPSGHDNVFAMTRSPFLNELIEATVTLYYEPQFQEATMALFNEKLAGMKNLAQQLNEVFNRTKITQEKDDCTLEQNAIIERNLAELWMGLEKFEQILTSPDRQCLVEGLMQTRAATEALLTAFEMLKAAEKRYDGLYSQSPHFNELIRITAGVMNGHIPPEALKEKLGWTAAFWNHSFKEFTIYKTQKFDRKEIIDTLPVIQQAFERTGEGLREMMLYFEDGDVMHLSRGSEVVREASNVLVQSHTYIQYFIAAENTRPCLRCGTPNGLRAKTCVYCQSVIPSFTQEEEQHSSIDIKVDDQVTRLNERMITSHVQSLIEIVAAFNADRGNIQDLKNILELLQAKIQEGRMMLEKLHVPPTIECEEDRILLTQSRSILAGAIVKMEQALQEMNLYFEDSEMRHLTDGLEMSLSANDDVVEVQKIGSQLWDKYNPPR